MGDAEEHAEIERLARAWQQGDRNAFEQLVLRLHHRLRIHVAAFCDSRELVDEVLQQTFITCFQRIDSFHQPGAFVAWLKAIARNHLMDHWRERRRCAALTGDVPERCVAEDGVADLEREEVLSERSRRLFECLERLSPRARRLLERRHVDQRPLAEMAQHFKQTVERLSVTLHRIRQALRRCVEGGS